MDRAIVAIGTFLLWLAMFVVAAIALVGFVDFLGTNLFNVPAAGAFELSEIGLVAIIFLSLPYAQQQGQHIVVEFISSGLRGWVRRVADACALLLSAGFFGMIAWRGAVLAMESFEIREFSQGALQIPIYPVKFALAFGAVVAAVECFRQLAHRLCVPMHSASGAAGKSAAR